MAQYSQRTLVGQAVSSFGKGSGEPAMITKVDAFTATNLSYTVPAGVTYMVAYIRAGGGGNGLASAGAGGDSSVAFAGGTITATGGNAANKAFGANDVVAIAGVANSGLGARGSNNRSSEGQVASLPSGDGAEIVAGGAVTAGATLAVTVGAGGTAGTSGAAGGSGYVYLEYQVKA